MLSRKSSPVDKYKQQKRTFGSKNRNVSLQWEQPHQTLDSWRLDRCSLVSISADAADARINNMKPTWTCVWMLVQVFLLTMWITLWPQFTIFFQQNKRNMSQSSLVSWTWWWVSWAQHLAQPQDLNLIVRCAVCGNDASFPTENCH